MFLRAMQSFLGTPNERNIKKKQKIVENINHLESKMENLTNEDLLNQTQIFRNLLDKGSTLDTILPEAFAVVREAAKRTLNQRHYDVQMIGGISLHEGKISEMKTGEGKTLVSTLAAYLNALSKKGVHIVTVNDYLAKRDSEWMGKIYNFLGLSVGVIIPGMDDMERKKSYEADITYGTNNEFGFDFLRDNMKYDLESMVQRNFNFAIVDEVDSILIDEARTPLIISGPTEDNSSLYTSINKLIPKLNKSDLDIDEKSRSVSFTELGSEHIEKLLTESSLLQPGGLYGLENVSLLHHANQAIRAHHLFSRDKDYIVKEGKVVIIDEFTGRMMEGRRYSEGLHQALEAKESVSIQNENQTLASITFQNYFRMYPKLSGMTGTARTEAAEFSEIYNLDVISIPTHLPMERKDHDDEIYRTGDEKWKAVTKEIQKAHSKNQPVLVGTTNIDTSEKLSKILKKNKIKHEVLNARHHEREAYIIAQAGSPGAVTIATNMAGRGTDIQLGGNLDMQIKGIENNNDKVNKVKNEILEAEKLVKESGGLYVIGTERHESRRIDNQLRGRSGRQGDQGVSKFFLSLEDDLMRIFGSERLDTVLKRLGLKDGEAIYHPWINKALAKAQQKVENRNFEIRKNLLRFDDVMNDQRKVIYEQRRDLMKDRNVTDVVDGMREEVLEEIVFRNAPEKMYPEQWNMNQLTIDMKNTFGITEKYDSLIREEGITSEKLLKELKIKIKAKISDKIDNFGKSNMELAEKHILLQVLDQYWKEHLLNLDHLRQGIGLRAYGQRDPLNEYKREAFNMFDAMLVNMRKTVTVLLMNIQIETPPPKRPETKTNKSLNYENNISKAVTNKKVGRNAPCPCGSGKKYKHCHGKIS